MTAPETNQAQDQTPSNKELNFRALEAKYQRELQQERSERERLTKELQERNRTPTEDDEEDSEPYVDHKKLNKKLSKFSEQTKQQTQQEIQQAVRMAREEEKKEAWIENNPDFYEVLQNNAEKFAQRAPGLAKSILTMPESFERQKLVYQNIKELGIDKPQQKQPSIQDKIDSNRRSPFYQPSNVGNSPYSSQSDFSPTGKKNAYDKMQELKARLRIN